MAMVSTAIAAVIKEPSDGQSERKTTGEDARKTTKKTTRKVTRKVTRIDEVGENEEDTGGHDGKGGFVVFVDDS